MSSPLDGAKTRRLYWPLCLMSLIITYCWLCKDQRCFTLTVASSNASAAHKTWTQLCNKIMQCGATPLQKPSFVNNVLSQNISLNNFAVLVLISRLKIQIVTWLCLYLLFTDVDTKKEHNVRKKSQLTHVKPFKFKKWAKQEHFYACLLQLEREWWSRGDFVRDTHTFWIFLELLWWIIMMSLIAWMRLGWMCVKW